MIARQILPLSTLGNVKKTVWRTYWCCWGVMGWKINITNNKFFKTFSSKKLEILPPSGCPPFVNCISTYFPWKWNRLKTILERSNYIHLETTIYYWIWLVIISPIIRLKTQCSHCILNQLVFWDSSVIVMHVYCIYSIKHCNIY